MVRMLVVVVQQQSMTLLSEKKEARREINPRRATATHTCRVGRHRNSYPQTKPRKSQDPNRTAQPGRAQHILFGRNERVKSKTRPKSRHTCTVQPCTVGGSVPVLNRNTARICPRARGVSCYLILPRPSTWQAPTLGSYIVGVPRSLFTPAVRARAPARARISVPRPIHWRAHQRTPLRRAGGLVSLAR